MIGRPWALRKPCLALGVVLAFLANLQLPHGIASSALDSSWSQVLAHALIKGVQWGPQLNFTYGPLGFVTPYLGYIPGMLWPYLAAQALVATLYALTVWFVLKRLPVLQIIAFCCCILVFGFWLAGDAAWLSIYALSIYAIADPADRSATWPPILKTVLVSVLPALLPLVKVTLLVPWACWLIAGVAIHLSNRQRALAWWHTAFGLGLPLAGWLVCGQSLRNLPIFLINSAQIAAGYNTAMQNPPANWLADFWAPTALFLAAALLVLSLTRHSRIRQAVWVNAMAMLVLLAAFKLGYTRADWAHLPIFAVCSVILLVTLPIVHDGDRSHRRAVIGLLFVAALTATMAGTCSIPGGIGYQMLTGQMTAAKIAAWMEFAFHPHRVIDRYSLATEAYRRHVALPAIRARVGRDPIDVISYEQGTAYANDLNLVFRPIFQGYSVYSSALAQRNLTFFSRPDAPRWILFKLQTIDGRLPSEDDPSVLSYISGHYSTILSENGYLLMERSGRATEQCTELPQRVLTATIGQWLPLDTTQANTVSARIDIQLSAIGKLKSLLLRTPIASIELRDEGGQTESFRLVPAIARNGFMLSPVLHDTAEYANWQKNLPVQKAASFRVVPAPSANIRDFKRTIPISIEPKKCFHLD